jgi:hypothetical protein
MFATIRRKPAVSRAPSAFNRVIALAVHASVFLAQAERVI